MAGKLQIDMNKLQNENLNILRRADANITKILVTASHAANYSFQPETNEWKKRDIEGPFFVVERKPTRQNQNMFAMIVLNRLSANNYVQYLNPGVKFQLSDPYIIFRTQNECVGFWFGNPNERSSVANVVERILNQLVNQTRMMPSGPQMPPQAWQGNTNASQHLLSMIKGNGNNANVSNRGNGNPNKPQHGRNGNAPTATGRNDLRPEDIELTKPQLQRMLIRMLEDDRFIGLLHQQYIQSLRKKKNQKQ